MFFSPLEQFDSLIIFSFAFLGFDFSFSALYIPLVVMSLSLIFFICLILRSLHIVSNFFQIVFELLFGFILDLIDQQIGIKGYAFMPYIFTLFIFILFSNLIGMMPFGVALTSHIIIIFLLSMSLGIATFLL